MPPLRPLLLRPLLRPLFRSPNHLHHLHHLHHHLPLPLLFPSPTSLPPPHHHPRPYSSSPPPINTDPTSPKSYTFSDLSALTARPSPTRLLIDVREPRELRETGRIPGAVNMPLTSNPDAFYLGEVEFLERFGFERPRRRREWEEDGGWGGGDGEESLFGGDEGEGGEEWDQWWGGVDSGEVNEQAAGAGGQDKGMGGGEEGGGQGVEEVIFYCKAGVRSRAAARLAREWGGIQVGQYEEGWDGWRRDGGKVQYSS